MDTIFSNSTTMVVLLSSLLGGLYAVSVVFIFSKFRKRQSIEIIYRQFFQVVNTIIKQNNFNLETAEKEIKLNFKKLSEKNPEQKDALRNPIDLLEELIFFMDSLGFERLKGKYGITFNEEDRKNILNLIQKMKLSHPYSTLPPKESNLLAAIKYSIESNNIELGQTSLGQLADQIEVTDSNLRIQTKRNQTSYLISLVGVILTIFFGLLSFIKLI